MPRHVVVPLIIAFAMFMQTLDSTILSTSIPAIARALDEPPLRLHLAVTSYMLSLAGFLPLSGWLADRFGARRVFRSAILIFTLASMACGFSDSLLMLLAARVCQGLGGAMMVPVGRLILVRSVAKTELIKAMTLMSMPALVGPIVGPPLGGLITTFASWQWIFWVNVPIGIVGWVMVGIFIEETRVESVKAFDLRGFIFSGIGLSAALFGFDGATTESFPPAVSYSVLGVGVVFLVLYARHARRVANPILDLKLLRVPTLRASIGGGSVFRIGIGAIPFLMPLFMQVGFGYSPLQSGLITFAASAGAFGIRGFSARVLARFGYRNVLIWDVLIAGVFLASYGLFRADTPVVVMLALLAAGGVFRSLGFSSINTLAFADIEPAHMSQATSFTFMAQRLSMTVGVALSAFLVHVFAGGAADHPPVSAFAETFVVIAIISSLSSFVFYRLSPDAGASLSGRPVAHVERPAAESEPPPHREAAE
ncbi:MAG TPA: MFS transporter [Bauldia sp.]|nr:MFS transporter [Bauldia sp.]